VISYDHHGPQLVWPGVRFPPMPK